jgi:hypothetical protein
MSLPINPDPPSNHHPESAGDAARQAAEAVKETAQRAIHTAKDFNTSIEETAKDVSNLTAEAAHCVARTAKDIYQSTARQAGDKLAVSKEYVRRNPVPVVVGAIALGVAIGYVLMFARRKPSFGERYADEPLIAVREALLGALAPVTQRVQKGYGAARDGADRVMEQVHDLRNERHTDSFADSIGRIGNNLKFW